MYNTDLPTRADLPTSRQLLRSTALAAAVAAGLLVTVVLPADYGVDPTGVGRALGLTQMGEIKTQLAAEAEADRRAGAPGGEATGRGDTPAPAVAREAPATAAPAAVAPSLAPAERRSALPAAGLVAWLTPIRAAAAQTPPAAAPRSDETTVQLRPNQGLEVKLRMRQGARATYAWSATGPVNFDLHGEPPNAPREFSHSYKNGRGASRDEGTLVAAFDGTHGWFWRNRSGADVTVTLRTGGDYAAVLRPE